MRRATGVALVMVTAVTIFMMYTFADRLPLPVGLLEWSGVGADSSNPWGPRCLNSSADHTLMSSRIKPGLILFHKFPDYYGLDTRLGSEVFRSCSNGSRSSNNNNNNNNNRIDATQCEITTDSRRFQEAEVVIFFSHQHINPAVKNVTGIVRTPGQIWVFFTVESPVYSNNDMFGGPFWRGAFNWTMSYRRDSDLWHGYGRVIKISESESESASPPSRGDSEHKGVAGESKRVGEENAQETKTEEEEDEIRILREQFRNKTKMAAWFVSNCYTQSRRQAYVSRLSRVLPVDIYGRCGTLKCADRTHCMSMLTQDYKFYLAFENSLCRDYVTEKLFKVFIQGGVVPVVRGGASYKTMFPPLSVIDAADFSSPEALGKYLLKLAEDEDEYIRHLSWRRHFRTEGSLFSFCELCQKIRSPDRGSCSYDNVYKWWTEDACN